MQFDNLSVEQMIAQDLETAREANVLIAAIRSRMEAACPVQLGRAYKIMPYPEDYHGPVDYNRPLNGRIILVVSIHASRIQWQGHLPEWRLMASGPLRRPVPDKLERGVAAGHYTSRYAVVIASRIDLSSESEP